MTEHDLIILGGGISGLSLAHLARARGQAVCVVEREARLGGALHSVRPAGDFWLELGGHTGYNSYGRLLGIVEALGLAGSLLPRETARWMLWQDGRAVSVPSQLGWLELAAHLPRLLTAKRAGASVADYYGRVLGRGNYRRVLQPMLSAVVSQDASDFPADLLFKKRPRRKELPRSFAFAGGLQSIAEAIAAQDGVTVRAGAAAERVEQSGAGWRVTLAGGAVLEAPRLAVATPPDTAARLLADAAPELAAALGRIAVSQVESEGIVVRAERVTLPRMAGLVGVEAPFHSVVTRDTVAHPDFRGFAFHFRPGTPPDERTARMAAALGCAPGDFEARESAARTLPAPTLEHPRIVAELDARLEGQPLAVTGNYFGGLAIEDCVARSAAEAERLG